MSSFCAANCSSVWENTNHTSLSVTHYTYNMRSHKSLHTFTHKLNSDPCMAWQLVQQGTEWTFHGARFFQVHNLEKTTSEKIILNITQLKTEWTLNWGSWINANRCCVKAWAPTLPVPFTRSIKVVGPGLPFVTMLAEKKIPPHNLFTCTRFIEKKNETPTKINHTHITMYKAYLWLVGLNHNLSDVKQTLIYTLGSR